MDERAPRIEIEVRGDPEQDNQVPLRSFARASDGLLDLLNQVASDRDDPLKVNWFVRALRTGSAVAAVEGVPSISSSNLQAQASAQAAAVDVVRLTLVAINAVEQGDDLRRMLSYPAIEKMRNLTAPLEDGVSEIAVRAFDSEVLITEFSAQRIKDLLHRKSYSFGSVEGKIETLSIHQKRPYFNVFHSLEGYAIKCQSDIETMTEAEASLGARVRVSGEIQRRLDGRPEVIQVARIRVLPDDDKLPQAEDIRGMVPDAARQDLFFEEDRYQHE